METIERLSTLTQQQLENIYSLDFARFIKATIVNGGVYSPDSMRFVSGTRVRSRCRSKRVSIPAPSQSRPGLRRWHSCSRRSMPWSDGHTRGRF